MKKASQTFFFQLNDLLHVQYTGCFFGWEGEVFEVLNRSAGKRPLLLIYECSRSTYCVDGGTMFI